MATANWLERAKRTVQKEAYSRNSARINDELSRVGEPELILVYKDFLVRHDAQPTIRRPSDNEIVSLASDQMALLRRRVRARFRRATQETVDDCVQESFLWVLENVFAIRDETEWTLERGKQVLRIMENAACRFMYHEKKETSKVSLSTPLGEEEGSAELGDMIIDRATCDMDTALDAYRIDLCARELSDVEQQILFASIDDVPLDEIAAKHELSVEQILTIKASALNQVRAKIFARLMVKSVFRNFGHRDITKYGSAA